MYTCQIFSSYKYKSMHIILTQSIILHLLLDFQMHPVILFIHIFVHHIKPEYCDSEGISCLTKQLPEIAPECKRYENKGGIKEIVTL